MVVWLKFILRKCPFCIFLMSISSMLRSSFVQQLPLCQNHNIQDKLGFNSLSTACHITSTQRSWSRLRTAWSRQELLSGRRWRSWRIACRCFSKLPFTNCSLSLSFWCTLAVPLAHSRSVKPLQQLQRSAAWALQKPWTCCSYKAQLQ